MASRRVQIGVTGETVRDRVKSIRKGQGLTLADVSQRLDGIGRSFKTSTLFDIENGGRRVDVDDLIVIASALGVSPITLLMPDTSSSDEPVVTSAGEVTAERYWWWLRTHYPLTGDPVRAMDNLEFQWRSKPSWHSAEVGQAASLSADELRELLAIQEAKERANGDN